MLKCALETGENILSKRNTALSEFHTGRYISQLVIVLRAREFPQFVLALKDTYLISVRFVVKQHSTRRILRSAETLIHSTV